MSRSAAVSLTPPPSRLADLTTIAAAFMQAFAPGLPRYLQLQNAIIGLIRSGELRSGAQLPPDQQLTGALDVSLGTVQKAFAGLASEGWISREHGRGTFIAQPRQPVTELWHYRFRDHTAMRCCRSIPVCSNGATSPPMNGCVARWARIRRTLSRSSGWSIGGKFTCYSELYLPAGRFSRILEIPITNIESVNLKKLFADEFGAPTISVEQSIRACQLEPDVARLIGVPKRACGMVLEATAFTYGRAANSFQRIHIPQSDYPLDVSPMPSAPRTLRQ